MGQISAKLRNYGTSRTSRGYAHWCPACKEMHVFTTERNAGSAGPQWTFDGNAASPTFSPSMKITGKQIERDEGGKWTGEWVRDQNGNAVDYCCHYILTAGVLNYCGDSTHALKGQSVPLPDLPAHAED